MSYASVAASNVQSSQPQPDQALLNTEHPHTTNVADDNLKVNVVSQDFKSHPETTTSVNNPFPELDMSDGLGKSPQARKEKAREQIDKAEEEGLAFWELAKDKVLQPGVAGGLIGVVNVGLLSYAGYQLYTYPELRNDTPTLGLGGVVALAVLGAESLLADQSAHTPEGRNARRKAKEEGDAIYRHTKEIVLRPGVMGGMVSIVNLGVLGTVGYYAYTNWDRQWDRRTISAVTVGLLTLAGGESVIAEKYKDTRHY
ncbi:hypothetical protein BD410DRAFT_789407 [Rickenella mellea]|uniref:Mitochondrial outer membrane protein OM14 C-terminal domain-containing protein n=1 Tax=Rickenella mellea TaxID=50990 RepID=A0A4Y7Q1Y8_9AGAM|nr:hypothetical protein BD410DRAFT_789407 [Rickenella mellea]